MNFLLRIAAIVVLVPVTFIATRDRAVTSQLARELWNVR